MRQAGEDMSISEKIKQASSNPTKVRLCKLGVLLAGSILSDQDKNDIISVINADINNPNRVSNVALAVILREEGFDISVSAVDRHKKKSCGCYNLSAGK
jgi:hypothetical protein